MKSRNVSRKVLRKRSLGYLVALLLVVSCTTRTERTIAELNSLLDSLRLEYAPDNSIARWEMNVSGSKETIILAGEVDSRTAYLAVESAVEELYPGIEIELELLPAEGFDRVVHGLVNNSVAHLRSRPSHLADLVSEALLGTPVRILKKEDDRFLVQTPNRYIGWVKDFEVKPLDEAALNLFRDAQKIIYKEQYGFSYSEPDATSLPVSDLVIGCMLPVLSGEAGFYQVQYPDGRVAWVDREEAMPAEEIFRNKTSTEGVMEAALRFHGIPYLWGGTSSKGLDCSGLSSTAYFLNGTILPRDADQQTLCGNEITTAYHYRDLLTGDLLFFGRRATDDRPESVTHVAIYLGDSEFIHASGYMDRVSINSMDSTRDNFIETYPEIFIRAVRIIGEPEQGFEPIMENDFYREIISTSQ